MSQAGLHSVVDLIGPAEHEAIDTSAPGYEPCLKLVREGNMLRVKLTGEVAVPLALALEAGAIKVSDLILERLAIDLRLDGAAEILTFLRGLQADPIGDVQGHA